MFAIRIRRAAAATSLLAAVASLAACDDSVKTAPATLAVITAESGASQNVVVGANATDSLKVQVTTSNATLAGGVAVDWSVTAGDGTISSTTTTTDANGESAIAFKAGTKAGLSQVSAKVTGLDAVLFSVQQAAAQAEAATLTTTEPTAAMLGAGSVPITVKIVDEFGNAVSGQTVFWSVSGGSGSFDLPSSISDTDGNAIVNFTPSGTAGTRTIQALTGDGITANVPLSVVSGS